MMAMVVKILGMALLMCCTVSIGCSLAAALGKRVNQLEACLSAVNGLEGELSCTLSPPDQAVQRLETRESLAQAIFLPACASLCRQGVPFPEAWAKSLKFQKGDLLPEDISLLSSLGEVLGQCPLEEQLAQLAGVRTQLDLQLQSARKKRDGYAKLYRSMGVLSGAFLIVVLL